MKYCKDCVYFENIKGSNQAHQAYLEKEFGGKCRINPPTIESSQHWGKWPDVKPAIDWCGRFTLNEGRA